MPKASPGQYNFSTGEFSELLYGAVEAERYKAALKICENYIPTAQGCLIRRPGSEFICEVKDSSKETRLVEFEFSTEQAYILEVGDQYTRFIANDGQVLEAAKTITAGTQAKPVVITSVAHGFLNGDEIFIDDIVGLSQVNGQGLNGKNFRIKNKTADTFQLTDLYDRDVDGTAFTVAYSSGGTAQRVYTLVTPWEEEDLFQLCFVQSADVLYVFHPLYAPVKLIRVTDSSWSYVTIDFLDGPYLNQNQEATTLTPGATTGSVTVTASSVVGINGGAGFQTTDIGRLVRFNHGAWTWGEITNRSSTTSVTVLIRGPAVVASATADWRLGLWSDTTGYPAAGCFFEDRLVLGGGTTAFPQRIDLSVTGDYENFAPSNAAGTVVDSDALSYNLNSQDVNSILWVSSDEKGLFVGTLAGEWVVRPFDAGSALSPTNVSARQVTSYGSSTVQPAKVGKSTMFVTRTTRKIREISFIFEDQGFQSPDRTFLADHITGKTGVKQLSYQKEPNSILWAVRNDGQLASMTFEKDNDSLIVGWARHILGGTEHPFIGSRSALVKSVAVIPSTDTLREDVFLIVRRQFRVTDGAAVPADITVEKRYIERLTRVFDNTVEQQDAFHVDAGLRYDLPKSITAVTLAAPGVFTSVAHGLSDLDRVRLTGTIGLLYGPFASGEEGVSLNDGIYYVHGVTADTFMLLDASYTPGANPFGHRLDTSLYQVYEGGGEIRKLVTTVYGSDHLEGAYVNVYADGASLPRTLVGRGGVVGLADNTSATTVSIGLNMVSKGQQLRLNAGSATGSAIGKTSRSHRIGMLLHRTMGLEIGLDFDTMYPVVMRTASDPMTTRTPLYSGIVSENTDADYSFENQVAWRQDGPEPGTILAALPQLEEQDRL